HLVLDETILASSLLFVAFFALYPTRPAWRSAQGMGYALMLAWLAASLVVWPLVGPTAGPVAIALFGPFSTASVVTGALALAMSVSRVPAMPETERAGAMRILAASGGILVFATYWLAGVLLTRVGAIHHTRYGLAVDLVDDPGIVARLAVEFGLFVLLCARHRQPIAWLFAGVGVAAVLLDQLSRQDIIDLGVTNLVLPLVVLAEATRRGALGVREVPARAALGVAAVAGLTAWVLLIALAQLVVPGDGFVLAVSTAAGLPLGAAVAYSVRPRALGIAVYRMTPTGAEVFPPRALAPATPRYRVEHKLGEGAQGEALLAHDTALDRPVVLKRVPPSQAREARLVGALDHPNVVGIHDVVEETGGATLVLEYVDGGDLRGLLARRGALEPREADRLLEGILAGLEAAHAKGIVHGDVKPENVLLTAAGEPRLADFGAARRAGPEATAAPAGTLLYMAPEQVRGEAPDPRSDLFAAALVHAEMLTGRPVRDARGLDDFSLRARILAGDELPELGARADFLRRALSPDPAARFASAAQMRAALASLRAPA